MVEQWWSVRLCRGGFRGRVQGVRTPPPERAPDNWYSPKICRYVWYVFSAVHIMLLPSQKPFSSYLLFKFVFNYQSVTLFLCGTPPLKKNPGFAPAIFTLYIKTYPVYYDHLFDIWLCTLEIGVAQQQQQNFINKLIILQKYCPQLARLFQAGPGGAMRANYEIKTNIKNPRYRKRAEVTVLTCEQKP